MKIAQKLLTQCLTFWSFPEYRCSSCFYRSDWWEKQVQIYLWTPRWKKKSALCYTGTRIFEPRRHNQTALCLRPSLWLLVPSFKYCLSLYQTPSDYMCVDQLSWWHSCSACMRCGCFSPGIQQQKTVFGLYVFDKHQITQHIRKKKIQVSPMIICFTPLST